MKFGQATAFSNEISISMGGCVRRVGERKLKEALADKKALESKSKRKHVVMKKEPVMMAIFQLDNKDAPMTIFPTHAEFMEKQKAKAVVFSEPFVVQEAPWLSPVISSASMKRQVAYWESTFAASSTIESAGRGQSFLKDATCQEHMTAYVPKTKRYMYVDADIPATWSEGQRDLVQQKLGGLSMYGLKPGRQHIGTEFGETGSIRVIYAGGRSLGVIKLKALCDFLEAEKVPKSGKAGEVFFFTMMDVQSYLSSVDSATLGRFMLCYPGSLWKVTLGVNSVVYVPQGSVTFEEATGSGPCFGLRDPVVSTDDGNKARVRKRGLLEKASFLKNPFSRYSR